jgi:hypothetical protein
MASSPLVEFFKRGEVARDVRLLAAEGALAPRAHEQLAILVVLLEDSDPIIRQQAQQTIDRIPVEALQSFLARSDVPIDLREFFADRGVFPAEIPTITADEPLFDADPEGSVEEAESEDPQTLLQRLTNMGFSERLKAAFKGSREMRAILVRDPNKMIAAAVLSSPKLTEPEVEAIAKMGSVSEDVLRTIGGNRAWIKNYGIVLSLTRNAKTPVATSLHLLSRLTERDMVMLSNDRNVPDPLRRAARQRVVAMGGGRD